MARFIDKEYRLMAVTILDRRSRISVEKDVLHAHDLPFDRNFKAYKVDNIFDIIDEMNNIRFAVGPYYGEEPGEKTMYFDYEILW